MRKLAILLVLAAMACGGDSTTAPVTANVVGTWNLQTINGLVLPFTTAQSGADKTEITADVLSVSGTGSFTETTTIRTTLNGQVSTQSSADAGQYTINGTAVSFVFNSDGSTGTGTLSGNTLIVADNGVSLVYKK
jgi:hypothetical protein